MEKIVFFGTSKFAVPALEALVHAKYDIVAVITQPDKPAGRKREPLPSPVKLTALKLGLNILQPAGLHSPFTIPHSDLNIVASYGKIIPKSILNIPKFGTLNIHPSLLPKYRGPSPIHAAILNGDKATGVTLMKLDEELDHGDIIAISKLKISKLYFKDLHDKLSDLGAELLINCLSDYISGKIKPTPQDHSNATFTKIIKKDDARIDWKKSAEQIDRMVRAYHLWPVAWTTLDGKRLKIYESVVLPSSPRQGRRGRIVIEANNLCVETVSSLLQILSLQLEGSRVMNARDFLNGNPHLTGKVLS